MFYTVSLFAQNPSAISYSTENGLPSNTIYNIFQNGDGYLYAGCDLGIVRFNGHHAVLFDSKKARSRAITGFVTTPDSIVYGINFSGELLRWDSVLTIMPTPNTNISQLACDSLGRVWIAGDRGLFVIYPGTSEVKEIKVIMDALKKDIGLFTGTPWVTQDSIVWFTGVNFVYCWDGVRLKKYSGDFNKQLPGQATGYMLFESQGEWYMMHKFSQRLLKLQGEYFKDVTVPGFNVLEDKAKLTNVVLLNNYWWICTYNGVLRYDPVSGKADHWFKDKVITDVHYDHEGNYWFSSLYEGLLWCSDLNIAHWRLNDDSHFTVSTSNGTSCLAAKQNGDLYLFDELGNSQQIDRKENSDIQFIGWNATTGNYEIASNGFLYKVVGSKTELVHSLFSSLRFILYRDNQSIYCSRSGTFRIRNNVAGLKVDTLSVTISRIAEFDERTRVLAVATNSGLMLYNDSASNFSLRGTCYPDSVIYTLCHGFNRGEWLFSTASGIIYSVNASLQPRVYYRPHPGRYPRQLVRTDDRIWISTNDGLLYIPRNVETPVLLNRNDGLVSNTMEHIFIQGSKVFISTPAGINRFPANIVPDRRQPRVRLNAVIVDGKQFQIPANGPIELPYNGNLTLLGDISGFCSEKGYEIGYRFSSKGSEWNYVTLINGALNFSGFPSGEWVLQVIVKDEMGSETPVFNVAAFSVIPPYWQRWWFYVLVVLVVVLLVVVGFGMYIKRLRARQLFDLRQLRLVNETRLSQQTALTAQMNPHFIFNVLNSIKAFIYENDKKQASLYLDRFSDLVRRVLQMSAVPAVRLEQELDLVKLYFELEALQFEQEPELEIKCNNPECLEFSIPSLLIQPYVENALKHGLRHKKGPKKLIVEVDLQKDQEILTISVCDNGVGRKASDAINKDRQRSHQSFATGATARRISLLNSQKPGLVGVQILDKVNESGVATGTRVELQIHLERYERIKGSDS
jgi:ligand-binding sensor domain-containing protein